MCPNCWFERAFKFRALHRHIGEARDTIDLVENNWFHVRVYLGVLLKAYLYHMSVWIADLATPTPI